MTGSGKFQPKELTEEERKDLDEDETQFAADVARAIEACLETIDGLRNKKIMSFMFSVTYAESQVEGVDEAGPATRYMVRSSGSAGGAPSAIQVGLGNIAAEVAKALML